MVLRDCSVFHLSVSEQLQLINKSEDCDGSRESFCGSAADETSVETAWLETGPLTSSTTASEAHQFRHQQYHLQVLIASHTERRLSHLSMYFSLWIKLNSGHTLLFTGKTLDVKFMKVCRGTREQTAKYK